MERKTIILIDNDSENLSTLESAIKDIDPSFSCISFIFADEAVRVVSEELKTIPDYIFIDVNMNRKTGTKCLADLRGQKTLENCFIIMFSVVMPHVLADAFKTLGANYAFQKPIAFFGYKGILENILNAESKAMRA